MFDTFLCCKETCGDNLYVHVYSFARPFGWEGTVSLFNDLLVEYGREWVSKASLYAHYRLLVVKLQS
jgi:hypothetical protein